MTASYKAPDIPADSVTPVVVRDELLRCFDSAYREFAQLINQPATDEVLRTQVKRFVDDVFQKCGVSFDNPTKAGIKTAIDTCKKNAEALMGTQGADIIRHHYQEMMKLVDKLQTETSAHTG